MHYRDITTTTTIPCGSGVAIGNNSDWSKPKRQLTRREAARTAARSAEGGGECGRGYPPPAPNRVSGGAL